MSAFEGLSETQLAERLGAPVHLFDSTPSTMDLAHDLARAGAPTLTTVLTDAQTAGRGRGSHTWTATPGSSLAMSLVLRPDASAVGVLSVRVAIALARALDPWTPDGRCQIKWPNDLMLPGAESRKAGGILVEARWRESALEWVVVGVGLNRDAAVHPGAGAFTGTRLDLLLAVHGAISTLESSAELTLDEMQAWRQRDWAFGRRVSSPAVGVARGIRTDGALLVENRADVRACHSGSLILEDSDASRL